MIPRYPRLLHDSLTLSAAAQPDKVAIVEGQRRITYAELHDQALRLATGLQGRGVRRGDRVALFLENSLETVVGIYAALYAGAAFMVVNPQTKEDKLEYVLSDAGASALISDARLSKLAEEVAPRLPSLRTLVRVGEATAASLSLSELLAAN